jgi:hypothetical protein
MQHPIDESRCHDFIPEHPLSEPTEESCRLEEGSLFST